MKQPEKKTTPEAEPLTLSHLVKQLIASYQPVAVQQNSFFVNDVPPDILLKADMKVFVTLLGSILYLIARCGKDTCIRITAKSYNDVLLMHIKDINTFNSYAILSKLQHLQMLARKIAGILDVTSVRNSETTISFSFTNKKNSGRLIDNDFDANDSEKRDLNFISPLFKAGHNNVR